MKKELWFVKLLKGIVDDGKQNYGPKYCYYNMKIYTLCCIVEIGQACNENSKDDCE